MWVESVNNRANLHRQGIQFSNDYIVNLKRNDNFDIIEFINIFEKDNLYRNFYGENIIDMVDVVINENFWNSLNSFKKIDDIYDE